MYCNTSSEIWTTLQQLSSTKSKARVLHLRSLLQSTKNGSMSIENYFLKMKSPAHELMAASQVVSDEDLIMYILGGLGPNMSLLWLI